MLLRGQNLLGYKHYSDDVVEAFCKAAVKNGIDRIRIFDALNDPRNMEAAIKYSNTYWVRVGACCNDTYKKYNFTDIKKIDLKLN